MAEFIDKQACNLAIAILVIGWAISVVISWIVNAIKNEDD